MLSSTFILLSVALASVPSTLAVPTPDGSQPASKQVSEKHTVRRRTLVTGDPQSSPGQILSRREGPKSKPSIKSSQPNWDNMTPEDAIPPLISKMVDKVMSATSDDPTTQTVIAIAQGAIVGAGGVLYAVDWWKKNIEPEAKEWLSQYRASKQKNSPLAQALGLKKIKASKRALYGIPKPMKSKGPLFHTPHISGRSQKVQGKTFFQDVDVDLATEEEAKNDVEEGTMSEFQEEVAREYLYAVTAQMDSNQRSLLRDQLLKAKMNGGISSAEWKTLTAAMDEAPAPSDTADSEENDAASEDEDEDEEDDFNGVHVTYPRRYQKISDLD